MFVACIATFCYQLLFSINVNAGKDKELIICSKVGWGDIFLKKNKGELFELLTKTDED